MGKHREPEQPEENGASQYPASGEEGGVGKRGGTYRGRQRPFGRGPGTSVEAESGQDGENESALH